MSSLISRRAFGALAGAVFLFSGCGDDPVSSGPVATSFVIVSGNPQSITVGASSAPLVVRVLDQSFNPMVGLSVAWSITSTVPGSLVANTTTTDAAGETSVVANAGLTPGTLSVRALIEGVTPLQFSVTITAPSNPPPQELRDPAPI